MLRSSCGVVLLLLDRVAVAFQTTLGGFQASGASATILELCACLMERSPGAVIGSVEICRVDLPFLLLYCRILSSAGTAAMRCAIARTLIVGTKNAWQISADAGTCHACEGRERV